MADAIEADYVVVGSGAVGMAFADTLVRHSDATVAIVDRRLRPGGHWNDAYPFIRIHLPSHYYGVESTPLGTMEIYRGGLNDGLLHMASGADVIAYYGHVMERVLLASGRVTYLPMSEYDIDGTVTSRQTGERRKVRARKRIVDATYSDTRIPATHTRSFAVADGVNCRPINDLATATRAWDRYCVVGSGKTGIDACLWLLANGASPERIRWIVSRDAWWINRARLQFADAYFDSSIGFVIDSMEAAGAATSLDDLFLRFEAAGTCFRLDSTRLPTHSRRPRSPKPNCSNCVVSRMSCAKGASER